jgi:hypothetical protein
MLHGSEGLILREQRATAIAKAELLHAKVKRLRATWR